MTPPATSPDLLLARRAAAGQSEAWETLVDLYGERIYNVALQFAVNPEEAEDLTQDIFLKLHRNLRRYRGDVPFAGWILRVSRNLCIDRYRSRRRERSQTVVSDEALQWIPATDDPEADAQRRRRYEVVHRALAEMDEEHAESVVLKDLQGWSLDEVAVYHDVPVGTVKSRLHRARRELAERVDVLLQPSAPGDVSILGARS